MTTPTDTPADDSPTAKPAREEWLSRLRAFVAADESRPAKLGLLGSVLITLGGLGAGSTRQHDPLLESIHMSWLRFGHGLVLSSIVLWAGVGLMLIAWLGLGRRVLAGGATEFIMKTTTGLQQVDVIYRRVDDDFIEGVTPERVPGILAAYK